MLDNPTPPDAGRSYSDREIEDNCSRWETIAGVEPLENLDEIQRDGLMLVAIIRQLSAERDAARAEVERLYEKYPILRADIDAMRNEPPIEGAFLKARGALKDIDADAATFGRESEGTKVEED